MTKLHHLAVAVAMATSLAACQQQPATGTDTGLPAGVQLISDQSKTKAAVAIPYKKYQLANGLTVLVHEDSSDPLVHVDVTYHVGSAREEAGKSGFAHFFEHNDVSGLRTCCR